jgi:hypothetical protein
MSILNGLQTENAFCWGLLFYNVEKQGIACLEGFKVLQGFNSFFARANPLSIATPHNILKRIVENQRNTDSKHFAPNDK